MIRLPRSVPFAGLLVALTLPLCAARASAQDAKPFPDAAPGTWGDGFPSVERVLEYARTDDPLETAKRRWAACAQVSEMVSLLSGNRGRPRPYDEWKYYREVNLALKAGLPEAEAERRSAEWDREAHRLAQDSAARDAMVAALFTPEWRARHWEEFLRLKAVDDAEMAAFTEEQGRELEAYRRSQEASAQERESEITIPTVVALPLSLLALSVLGSFAFRTGLRARARLAREQSQGRSLHSFVSGVGIVDVQATTGTVPAGGFSKMSGTEVHVSEHTVSSSTWVRDDLFLIDDQGTESTFRIHGFDLACRPGNRVTVLHAVRRKDNKGPYVVVHNWTTRKGAWDGESIGKLAAIGLLPMILLILLVVVIAKSAGLGMLASFGIVLACLVVPALVLRSIRIRRARAHLAEVLAASPGEPEAPAA